MKRVIFLVLALSLGLNASHECKELSEQREIARAAEVRRLMYELEALVRDHDWPKRRDIIARLIRVYDINPNDILYSYDKRKPLRDAVTMDDLIFASFLLNHGANPNTTKGFLGGTVLFDAQSKLMAQLLFGHGAQIIETPSERILENVITHDDDPALIPLYIAHGADVNAYQDGMALLMRTVIVYAHKRKQHISELLKAHALLSPEAPQEIILGFYYGGMTAPAILKEQLDRAMARVPRDNQEVADLQEIRAMMKRAYEEGECKGLLAAVGVHLIPDLAKMCVESYEDLERYQRRQ